MVASAEGYQSATKEIPIENEAFLEFRLDYTCNYTINVHRGRSPAIGAEVRIYKVRGSPRPLSQRVVASMGNNSLDRHLYEFQWDEREMWVSDMVNFSAINQKQYQEIQILDGQPIFPALNDRIYSLSSCVWNRGSYIPEDRQWGGITDPSFPLLYSGSEKVRILDTIGLAGRSPRVNFPTIVQLIRNGNRIYTQLGFADLMDDAQPIQYLQTDSEGLCQITDLSPGLYYAQAEQDGRISQAMPLHPASGGVDLNLSHVVFLNVNAYLAGFPDEYEIHRKTVTDAQITIKRVDPGEGGIYHTKTNSFGTAYFSALPLREYVITAIPPESSGLSPIEQNISLHKPEQTIDLYFEGWTRYTMEGEVVQMDNGAFVPGLMVDLLEMRNGGYEPCARAESNQQGVFRLSDLPKGRYKIAYYPETLEGLKYYPYNEKVVTSRRT